MENMKLAVTKDKREETVDKILKLIEIEFSGIEVTGAFTIKLLEDTIKALESRCLEAPLKLIDRA